MAFPTTLPSYTITAGSETANGAGGGTGLSGLLNAFEVDITALATKLGTGASTPTASKVLRATGTGTSAWGQVVMATDLAAFTSADLASVVSDETGSGKLVFGTSPTIVTPTIADFTNAAHGHTNAAGGGQLGFSALLSTIFSGQLQTQANAGSAGGNMWWINLGGIKLLWAFSAAVSVTAGGSVFAFTLPAFFTTIQTAIPTLNNIGSTANQAATTTTTSTSSISVQAYAVNTTVGTENISLFVIGT